MTQVQLGSIINQITGARAELKALEQQARNTAAEAAATQRHLRDIQEALVEHFMRIAGLEQQPANAPIDAVKQRHRDGKHQHGLRD